MRLLTAHKVLFGCVIAVATLYGLISALRFLFGNSEAGMPFLASVGTVGAALLYLRWLAKRSAPG